MLLSKHLMNNMDLVLSVKDLSVSFSKEKNVLKDVSFEVKKGEIISLIGLNGTGKSTLLKSLIGLIKPSKGNIKNFGSKVFYIPQTNDLNMSFPLSVKEYCDLFANKSYKKYLNDLGMKKFLNRKVSNLSGGEFQRVQIAIALSQKPDLLLLDEVTSGVDVIGQDKFYQMIYDIRKKYGISIIHVSHDIHLVLKNTDQVLCLSGHICCSGKPEQIKDNDIFKKSFGNYLQPYVHKHDHVH